MSWYKSLAYFPDNINIPYGCCDFSSVYEGVGSDAGFVRFLANENSIPMFYMVYSSTDYNLFPIFEISSTNYPLESLTGSYYVVLGGDSIFWGKQRPFSASFESFPRIEVQGRAITLYANMVDSWSGTFPPLDTPSILTYNGKREPNFVQEYGWETVSIKCLWYKENVFRSVTSEGIYTCDNPLRRKCFGSPMWTYVLDGVESSCVQTSSNTVLDLASKKTAATLVTDDSGYRWVIQSSDSMGHWESETNLVYENVGDETVFKYKPNDENGTVKDDIVFKFVRFVAEDIVTPVLLTEVALWR